MRWVWMTVLLAGMARPAEEPEVWVFFSADSPDAAPIFRALEGRRVRPVFLAERYAGAAAWAPAARAAGGFLVVDEEGLREAERLGLTDLPAVAVRHDGKVHVACGAKLAIREVLECSR